MKHAIKRRVFFWRNFNFVMRGFRRLSTRLERIQKERKAELIAMAIKMNALEREHEDTSVTLKNLKEMFPAL